MSNAVLFYKNSKCLNKNKSKSEKNLVKKAKATQNVF